MTIAYQLCYECANWTHGGILNTSTDYDTLEKQYHEFLGECLMDSVVKNNDVDYVCIEMIDVEFDDDGHPATDDDNPVCVLEYTFNDV